jgi:predicted DNA binding CopG/RHH family protein
MKREPDFGPESAADLERELERYQEKLYEFDRSLQDQLPRGSRPSLEQRRERCRIVRQLNRIRRELSRVKKGAVRDPLRRITLQVSESEYGRLQALAQEEGLNVPTYIRAKLFPKD